MKVISKENTPQVEFGDKVRTKTDGRLGDLLADTIGVVTSNGIDSDGEVNVRVPHDYDYFNPKDLEVLQKFSGEEIEAEKSVVIELTVTELKHIVADMGINTGADTQRGLEAIGFSRADMNGVVAQKAYSELKDLLMEVA
ncbi:hypothetical protein [Enterococcus gallinarum]|uniref:hypothetical protein n=1 Tax=Enterococcus gallinarum TaxID=1353 RepID=UPI001AD689FA|nr:hypothetical protein [Enterococcus gallinarum]MBO6417354.1 hypothetical protein [Enterococcus gallinarum]MBO6423401.1 hypothetical protein [Enterococcus gallinarum]